MKALIFDMDGVMIDSEIHWNTDQGSFLHDLIPEWTDNDVTKIIGLSLNGTHQILKKEYGLTLSEQEFIDQIIPIADRIYAEKTNLLDGFLDFLMSKKDDHTIGLASSSKRRWIDKVLDRFNLRPHFQVTVSAEEIDGPGKPAPDIYLHTAKTLGIAPEQCTVIEDSAHGIESAKAAGMTVIGLRNGFNDEQDLSASNIIVNGFKELMKNSHPTNHIKH
jgi:HAD superfamily hydrolase (TIGR01509 family)